MASLCRKHQAPRNLCGCGGKATQTRALPPPVDDFDGLDDPCDEMVGIGQVVRFIATRPPRGITTGNDIHGRLAAILGVPRDEAKRRMHSYLYSGGRP